MVFFSKSIIFVFILNDDENLLILYLVFYFYKYLISISQNYGAEQWKIYKIDLSICPTLFPLKKQAVVKFDVGRITNSWP